MRKLREQEPQQATPASVSEPPAPEASLPPKTGSLRDPAIDVLRGWAIVLMIFSHVGEVTVTGAIAHFPIWLSAADSFILISGIVLGMRAQPRLEQAGIWPTYKHTWQRAFALYRLHLVLMVAVVLVHEWSGKLHVANVADVGGYARAAFLIAVLRLQSVDFMNILPLFVIFMLVSPLFLEAFRRGWSFLPMMCSVGLWALAQHNPDILPLPDAEADRRVFSLGAWQLIFFVGLLVGYHRKGAFRRFWDQAGPFLLWSCIFLTGALFVFAQMQRSFLRGLGLALPVEQRWLFAKSVWGPGRAVYTIGTLFLFYTALRYCFGLGAAPLPASRLHGLLHKMIWAPLELMGKKSLYCFVMHLPFALLAVAFNVSFWPAWTQELFTLFTLLSVYWLAKLGVLARYIPN